MKEKRNKLQEKNDFQILAEFEDEYKEEEAYFENLKQEMQKERNSNIDVQKWSVGKKGQYGQPILLRHVFTDKYLAVEPNTLSDENGFVHM